MNIKEKKAQEKSCEREVEEYEFPDGVPDDIRERIERFERGETKLIPAGDITAKYGVKR